MLLWIFQILLQVVFVLGFLLHNVLFLFKHFTNFNMSDEQGACALTVNLASDIFYHRADGGCPY